MEFMCQGEPKLVFIDYCRTTCFVRDHCDGCVNFSRGDKKLLCSGGKMTKLEIIGNVLISVFGGAITVIIWVWVIWFFFY